MSVHIRQYRDVKKATVYRNLGQKGVVIDFDDGSVTLTDDVAWRVMECLQRLHADGWAPSEGKKQ